jgi:hypothetical protein
LAPKLIIEPIDLIGKDLHDDLMIAVAGAGDSAFIDKIVERAWRDAQKSSSFDQACTAIEDSIKATYQEFGLTFQPGYMPNGELVYGVKMQGQSKLFLAHGPIVNESRGYSSWELDTICPTS